MYTAVSPRDLNNVTYISFLMWKKKKSAPPISLCNFIQFILIEKYLLADKVWEEASNTKESKASL